MTRYIMRLDDASEKRDIGKWNRMEKLLDKYSVKPLVAVIPECQDPDFQKYPTDENFWNTVHSWEAKGWIIALHGLNHRFRTTDTGINPVNKRSEFAGVSLEDQKKMIQKAQNIFKNNGLSPKVFVAPAHTFDENTIIALRECSGIRIISDTPANDSYSRYGMTFVPQQSGSVRKMPFKTVTFCYHPNTMSDDAFESLEAFLKNNTFSDFPLEKSNRALSLYDRILMSIYYWRHR